MIFDSPAIARIPQLRQLWSEAFGDSEETLDAFFNTAFSPLRCLCTVEEDAVIAAAYWFSCGPYAYIYAVATAKAYRGRGICHALMEKIHTLLKQQGYAGAIVVPGEESLRQFYGSMGYENFGGIRQFTCAPGPAPAVLRQVDDQEFAQLRTVFLPEGGVVQKGENLTYLRRFSRFYTGDHFLLTCMQTDDTLQCFELLGNIDSAPGILTALGAKRGIFRAPGTEPFAMYKPLNAGAVPTYFGFAFD